MLQRILALASIVLLFTPYTVKAQQMPVISSPIVEDTPLVPNEAVADSLYQQWLIDQETPKKPVQARIAPNSSLPVCSCVLVAKAFTGVTQSIGNARNWPRNSSVPVVGGVVITNESRAGHVAFITSVSNDEFSVKEGNYEHCKLSTRTIAINSPFILGYWKSE